jgi:hypothetical protein
MLRNGITLFFFFLCIVVKSQDLKGKIIDEGNKQSIPFAVITIDNSNNGTTADLDGSFQLSLSGSEKLLTVHIIGYQKKNILLSEHDLKQKLIVKLKPEDIRLLEVIVSPKEDPANEIIRNVIKNKSRHDIRNLPYYWCNTYAKTYFTLSNKEGEEDFYEKDSIKYKKAKKLLSKQYLLFMESVTEKKYQYKNISQEKVLSSRISGFKSAPFASFASQLQSFSFYNDNIELLGQKFVNPLMEGTFKRYNFSITDTVLKGNDTIILIKYAPKKNAKFPGMKGFLYINKFDYAIQNVMAEPAEIKADGTGIIIQQLYEKLGDQWFPKQSNTEILFYGAKLALEENDKSSSSIMKAVSRLYVNEVKLDSNVKIKQRNIETLNAKDFDQKNETFWVKYRNDTLDEKELSTYRIIDSLGKEANLDQKLTWFKSLITGKFPLGYINIDLNRLLRANDYEGFRAGIGLSTSDKLTPWFNTGAYIGYGTTDKAFKYGAYTRINLNGEQSTWVQVEGANEVVETAGTFFLNESNSAFSTENIRNLMVNKMDKIRFGKASINFSLAGRIKASAYLMVQQRESPSGFFIVNDGYWKEERNHFTVNETGLQFRYWPGEKFTESMGQLVSNGSKWPVIYLNISKGLTNTLDVYRGEFDFTKIDLRIDQQWNFKVKGFLSWQIQAGKVIGDVPYSFLYNNKSSRSSNYFVTAEKSFETMYLNEFISSQYCAVFIAINSGRLFKNNNFSNPELELVHNFGIGSLKNRERLTLIELNDISKGFSEAGVRIKNIYKSGVSSFGAALYYRYGNYTHPVSEKNLVAKAVLGFTF